MKWSSRILLSMLIILVGGLVSSNMILKKVYDKLDKGDIYWTFVKVSEQPFKYLKVEGGNITNIAFEQNAHCSFRILNEWNRFHNDFVKVFVKSDTLFVKFIYTIKNLDEKFWMQRMTLVRIFSPELLYVEGRDTKMEMFKLKQKSISLNMSGKSSFEIESMERNLDSICVIQKDSSEVVIEMSPEFNGIEPLLPADSRVQLNIKGMPPIVNMPLGKTKSKETMFVGSVTAAIQGNSLLDIGHAQINNLQLKVADSSGVILSGGALKKISK